MKRYFTLLLLIISTHLFSQTYSITGIVTTTNNKPLPDASVFIQDTKIGTSSLPDGTFTINEVIAGNYTIICSFLGYQTIKKQISINKNINIDFELLDSSLMADEIVISSLAAQANTPVAQSNLNMAQIKQNNMAADIPFQLELTPSVVSSSENGTGIGYTNLRIRGTDMSRINVCVNGIPLNDSESQGVFWVNMPDFTSSVDNIQIQRGVGTSTNGAGAFGANLHFNTRKIQEKPYFRAESTIGSFKTFKRSFAVGTGLLNNHFSFDFRYSKLNSDGWVKRGFSNHNSLFASLNYLDKKNILKLILIKGEEHTGITWWGVPDYMMETDRRYNPSGKKTDSLGNVSFYDNESDNYWQDHYQLHYTHSFSSKWNIISALHYTKGRGYYEVYQNEVDDWGSANAFSDYGLPNAVVNDSVYTASDMINRKSMDNHFYGLTLSTNYKNERSIFTLGTAWNQYLGDHFGTIEWSSLSQFIPQNYQWYTNTGNKIDYMIYSKLNYQLFENFYAFIDFQYRYIDYSIDGIDDDLAPLSFKKQWHFINPKAGVTYNFNKYNKLYLSYARANREPTRSDITANAKDESSKIPSSETLNDVELGFNRKKDNIYTE
ncbi:MAG: TonB-dependent receptor [Bacteroidales bacterium]|nr:TonB-dependent receptor [Bacteroidales bacterium]